MFLNEQVYIISNGGGNYIYFKLQIYKFNYIIDLIVTSYTTK